MKDLLKVLWNRFFWKPPPDCPTCGLPLVEKTKEKKIRGIDGEIWGPFTGIGVLAGLLTGMIVAFILDNYNTPKHHVYAIGPSFFLVLFSVFASFSTFGFWIGSSFLTIQATYFPCPSLECEEKEKKVESAPVQTKLAQGFNPYTSPYYGSLNGMTVEQYAEYRKQAYMNARNSYYYR